MTAPLAVPGTSELHCNGRLFSRVALSQARADTWHSASPIPASALWVRRGGPVWGRAHRGRGKQLARAPTPVSQRAPEPYASLPPECPCPWPACGLRGQLGGLVASCPSRFVVFLTYDLYTVTSTDLRGLAWQTFTSSPGKSSPRLGSGPCPAPAPGSVCPAPHRYPHSGNQSPTSATKGPVPVL